MTKINTTQISPSILLTIDVEDWFQVENFKQYISFSSWAEKELRVEKNTHRLLDLFDSMEVGVKKEGRNRDRKQEKAEDSIQNQVSSIQYPKPGNKQNLASEIHNNDSEAHFMGHTTYSKQTKNVRATFFVLGWIAERLPQLVREIYDRGHEVASHGYSHELCYNSDEQILKNDLIKSKKLLEDITGEKVYGYRAPSFSINNDVLSVIRDSGYLYDSSYNNFGMHGRYGKLDLSDTKNKGIAIEIENNFYELPISNLTIHNPFSFQPSALSSKIVLPFSGGGYFRLFPSFIFNRAIKNILNAENTYVFYMHPWEIDPGQPRVNEAAMLFKFRHYINLKNSYPKLHNLITKFKDVSFSTCHDYLMRNIFVI